VSQTKKTFTGKVYGKQDDIVITLQLALIAAQRFWQEPRYSTLRSEGMDLTNARERGLR